MGRRGETPGIGRALWEIARLWGAGIARFAALSIAVQSPLLALAIAELIWPSNGLSHGHEWLWYISSLLAMGAIARDLVERRRGERPTFFETLGVVVRRGSPLLILGAAWTAVNVGVAGLAEHGVLGDGSFGYLLCKAAVAAAFVAAVPIAVVENADVIAALRRSVQLVKTSVAMVLVAVFAVGVVAVLGPLVAIRVANGDVVSPEPLRAILPFVEIAVITPLWGVAAAVIYEQLSSVETSSGAGAAAETAAGDDAELDDAELDNALAPVVRFEASEYAKKAKRRTRVLLVVGGSLVFLWMLPLLFPGSDEVEPESPDASPSRSPNVKMRKLVRPPLALAVPKWQVVKDAASPALGTYHVEDADRAIRISWAGGEPMDVAALQRWIGWTFYRSGSEIADRDTRDLESHALATAIASVEIARGKRGWVSMTGVFCRRTHVKISISVTTPTRKATEALVARMMPTFRCVGESPKPFALRLPASSAPPGFGYARRAGELVLAHRDTRRLVVVPSAGDLTREARAHPERVFGALELQSRVNQVSEARRATGLGGVELLLVSARIGGAIPIVAGVYYCREQNLSFSVLGIADETSKEAASLSGLVERFGCPGAGPPIDKRKSACDAGVKSLCSDDAPKAPRR